jgi:LysR family hydrogen peroxide-inducible transcriptional activator
VPPLPFSLRQLQYAVAIADELSFRRAALRCHVSQPSLSAQLAQLEHALGVPLFERNRRRVLVTEAGRPLLDRARSLLVAAEDIVAQAREARDPLAGMLRLGVIPTVSPYLLPAIAPRLRARFPRLRPVWVEDKTAALLSDLAAGQLDAALLAVVPELASFEQAAIARDPFVLVARRDHPLGAASGPLSTAELRSAEVLLLDEGHCLREQALELCARSRARELEFRATSLSTLVQMVAGGAGVTLLPELALATETRRAGLRTRRFVPPSPGREIALAWRRGSPLAPALRQLAAAAREAYPRG